MIHSFGKRSPGSKPEAPGSEIDSKASGRLGQYFVSAQKAVKTQAFITKHRFHKMLAGTALLTSQSQETCTPEVFIDPADF